MRITSKVLAERHKGSRDMDMLFSDGVVVVAVVVGEVVTDVVNATSNALSIRHSGREEGCV